MKKLLISIIFTSALFANMYDFKMVNITKNISCSIGEFEPPTKHNKANVSNVCYVDIGDSLVVIEPGPTYVFAKEFTQIIENKTGKKVSAVIGSNYHDDRIYGASYYKTRNIPFIAHTSMPNDIKKNTKKFKRLPQVLGKDTFTDTTLVYPSILVEDGYSIKGSKLEIKILKLSKVSDAPSDIVIYVPKEKFVFVGNIISNNRMIKYHYDSNLNGWLEALNKISKMDLKYIVPGHGDTFVRNSYKKTKEYLLTLKKVKKYYEDDVDITDIKIDFSAFKNRIHFKDLVNGNVKRYYEQLEWEE